MPRFGWVSPVQRPRRTGPSSFDIRTFLARQMGVDPALRLVAGPFSTYRGEEADYVATSGAIASLRLGPVVSRGCFGGARRRVTAMMRSRQETVEIDGDAIVTW